jgi:single stranded DNA-binding protein
VNRVILLGNLGRDPHVHPGGSVVVLALATTTRWKTDKPASEGGREWHRIVLLGDLAQEASCLKKGCLIYVEGRLQAGTWLDAQGGERHGAEVVATRMRVFDQSAVSSPTPKPAPAVGKSPAAFKTLRMTWDEIQRDIPF